MKNFFKIALLSICIVQVAQAQYKRQSLIDSLNVELYKLRVDTNKVNILYELTKAYDGVDQTKALNAAKQGYILAQKIKWQKGQFRSLRYMSGLYMDLGKNQEALKSSEKLFALSEKANVINEMVMSLNNIGAVYERTSKYTLAADYFFKALKIAERSDDERLLAMCESNIAVLFIHQKDYNKAIRYSKKAEERYSKVQEPFYRAKNLEILGNCYAFDGKVKQSIPHYQKAQKLYEQIGDKLGMATIYTQMVNSYPNDPLQQIEYLRKAKLLWDEIAPDNINAVANTGNFGFTYFEILKNPVQLKSVTQHFSISREQMLKDAESYLKESITLSKKAGVFELVSQLTIVYSQFCEYKKDYKGALDNLKEHFNLQDSLSSQDIKNKIAGIESEREIAIRDKEIQTRKLEMRQFWLYGIIAVFVVVLISFYFLNRARIRQLRLKNELQEQAADEQAKELMYRNKLSESELKAIRSQMNPHFIFNVLNSIESYILENKPEIASRLVQKFATLSRLVLENSIHSLVTAYREWKVLNLYTELEAMRFGNSFSYLFHVGPQIDLTKLMLPPMLVQPLIENSIHHGIRNSSSTNKTINISLNETESEIVIIVEDNGIGLDESANFKAFSTVKNKSIGLEAIRERIEILNSVNQKFQASFEIYQKSAETGTGTIATIILTKMYL